MPESPWEGRWSGKMNAPVFNFGQPFEDRQRPARERHAMFLACFHARGRDCPGARLEINL
jgi:hypothetical protein